MRFYGSIETNLINIATAKGITDIGYSIDSLLFETVDGKTFSIDFEEADYSAHGNRLDFRLKSLGITFEETWSDLYRTKGVAFENDIDFFKTVTLNSISLYIPEHSELIEEDFKQLEFEVIDCELVIGNDTISYDVTKVIVEYQ